MFKVSIQQIEDNKDEEIIIKCHEINDEVLSLMKKLKEKERYILTERYIIGKTQMELSSELGISQAQISRLEKSGLDNLKRMID